VKWVVGISGASGAAYAERLLAFLAERAEEDRTLRVEMVASTNGRAIYHDETGAPLESRPFRLYGKDDFRAPFASGSAPYDGMAVVPCSGGTLGRIASGASENLLTRAAEVMLKERRKLLLVFRESPLSLVHIENMASVTRAGGTVLLGAPVFYSGAKTREALVDTVVARILDHMGIPHTLMPPWGGGE
jgi:4-hydroxy-3-polyprenylbenzoate decarboxylase